MQFASFIINWIQKKFPVITEIIRSFRSAEQALYRIEEINTSLNEVVLHSRGARATLRTTITETIADHNIVNNLSALQACWLGYYYGKQQRAETSPNKKSKHASKHVAFNLQIGKGHYKIVSQEREGEIKYIDVLTRKEFKDQPLDIAQNELLISQFDPSQACYIGMLAGLAANRHGNLQVNKQSRPILRIVK
jgi:hypothetical protein